MKLVDFIEAHQERILADWEAFARKLLPDEQEGATLRDHGRQMLESVTADMRTSQTEAEQTAKSKERRPGGAVGQAATTHAEERFESGLRLDAVVAEYRALRASVLRLWGEGSSAADVGEIVRFNEAIDESLLEATSRFMEMIDQKRTIFLGVLGHDLRNPLNAIVVGAAALASGVTPQVTTAKIVSRITSSARRMERLISELLDLTRGRSGMELPVEPRPGDLGEICREVLDELRTAHPDVPLRLQTSGDLRGEWDGERLAQVVSNLVANAVQHGEPGALVEVALRAQDDSVVLEVHNQGPPIPKKELATIFDPLRSAPSGTKTGRHVGLGLYVAEQIALAHGGSVSVSSTTPEGTTFTVRLPRASRMGAATPDVRSVA